MYILINNCYGTSEFNLEFIKELFNKFPPTDEQLTKFLYKLEHVAEDSENDTDDTSTSQPTKYDTFNDRYNLVNYNKKKRQEQSSKTVTKPYIFIQNKETKLYYKYWLYFDTVIQLFETNNKGFNFIEYVMHRNDDIILKDGKFTYWFYKMLIPRLGPYKFSCTGEEFEKNTIDISNTDMRNDINEPSTFSLEKVDATLGKKSVDFLPNEPFYLMTVYSNSYVAYKEIGKHDYPIYYKLPFDESNWRTSGIASYIYFYKIFQNKSGLRLVDISDGIDFELTEYDGMEDIRLKIPHEKIIEELLKHIKCISTFIEPIMDMRGEVAKASEADQPNMSKFTKALLYSELKVNELYKTFADYTEL
jgi:hypothetical protein